MKRGKRTFGSADVLLLSCQVDSTVLVVGSRRKLLFYLRLCRSIPWLYRALQVVFFKTNPFCLLLFLFSLLLFLVPVNVLFPDFRNTTTSVQSLPVHSSVVLLLFFVSLFWLSTSLDDTWHTPDNMDDSGKRLGTRQVFLAFFSSFGELLALSFLLRRHS